MLTPVVGYINHVQTAADYYIPAANCLAPNAEQVSERDGRREEEDPVRSSYSRFGFALLTND